MTWVTAAIGDLAHFRGGGTPSKSNPAFFEGHIPWVSSKDMKSWTIERSQQMITEEAVAKSPAKLLPQGTVLVVVRSGILKHTLPVALATRPVTINQDLKGLVCQPHVDACYLARMIKAAEPVILGWVRATTADNFPVEKLKNLEIPLPPLPEQKRIAGILDQADELRRLRKQASAKVEHLRVSLLDSVCTRDSVLVQLSSLFSDIKMGPFGSLLHKSDYVSGGVPLINPMHIAARKIAADPAFSVSPSVAGRLSSYALDVDDIIIGRRGEMGRAALVLPEQAGFLCGTGSMRLRVERNIVLPEFMADFLSHPRLVRELENAASGVTMLNLSSQTFSKIKVSFPILEHQARYVEAKRHLTKKRDVSLQSSQVLDRLFTSLQHRASRGEL